MHGRSNVKSRRSRNRDDGARKAAKASGGKLNTDQVRILRALLPGKTIDKADLKDAVGIGRDKKYTQQWNDALWDLHERKYIVIDDSEKRHYFTITSVGERALEEAELGPRKEHGNRKELDDLADSVPQDGDGVDSDVQVRTTREANDLTEPPGRIQTTTYRILRDTELARRIKRLHKYKCQICGLTIRLPDGSHYAEAHHIRPLGSPHSGPDIVGNVLCLCPNHHAELDIGASQITLSRLRIRDGHTIDPKYIEYHNSVICTRKHRKR